MGRLVDLSGKVFDRWTVICRAENVGKRTFWLCRCACGEERPVNGSDLNSGKSGSCGCLHKEIVSEVGLIDLVGMKFGRLSVIARHQSSPRSAWLCHCECGNAHVAQSQYLRGGQTTSCGCFTSEKTSLMHRDPEFRRKRLDGIRSHWEYSAFMQRMEQEQADWEANQANQSTTEGDRYENF